jgi:glycosyltransferase involved in cell wall biosynthesis
MAESAEHVEREAVGAVRPVCAPRFRLLSILVAAYNEAPTIRRCLETVLAAELPAELQREVVVVDDASTDRTWEIVQEWAANRPEVRVFRQPQNLGKGAAIRRAIREMRGDLVIFQDADLEYDPRDYGRLLGPLLAGKADVVFGSRFTGEERKVLYFWHTLGNRLLTLLANMLNDSNLTDMETCYKAFVADRLRAIPLESNRFGLEPEIAAKVCRNRFRLYEVPISYNGRTYEEGKKIRWHDGVAAFWWILRYRFSGRYSDSGRMALDALEQAPRFNRWMYESIKPFCGRRLAELGCGRGNLTRWLLQHGEILATDNREEYLAELGHRWGHLGTVQLARLDLICDRDYEVLRTFAPDTVVCLNVLEHIEDDQAVLLRLARVLPAGANLVFLVPFDPRLMSEFDRQIGHVRRYDEGELESKMEQAGFKVRRQFYFNKVGVWAWWLGNTLTGQRAITPWQLRCYNAFTPLFRLVDRLPFGRGLSTVVIASRTEVTPGRPPGQPTSGPAQRMAALAPSPPEAHLPMGDRYETPAR